MARNYILRRKTQQEIDERVERVLARLGNPEPPLDLRVVRDLLSLDLAYFRKDDPSLADEVISRMRMASKQIIRRPMLFLEAVAKFDLRALYLPDNKRILLDRSQPELKHRWHEAHEIGHSIIPWHEGAMLGDDRFTLNQNCHDQVEAEANFAAGRLLFLRDRFTVEARDHAPSIEAVRALKPVFGNTYTTTFWRSIETWGASLPIVGMISDHPHPARRSAEFDPATPCEHLVRSPAFAAGFSGVGEAEVFEHVSGYCQPRRAGPLGEAEIVLADDNGDAHVFRFESFSNTYQTLTLGVYQRPYAPLVRFGT